MSGTSQQKTSRHLHEQLKKRGAGVIQRKMPIPKYLERQYLQPESLEIAINSEKTVDLSVYKSV